MLITDLSQLPDTVGGKLAIDTETNDPCLKTIGAGWAFEDKGGIAGISIMSENFQGYIPIAHENPEDNLPKENVLRWLQHILDKDPILIFANAIYDLGWFRREKVSVKYDKVHDVLIQMALLDEQRFKYDLDSVAKDYLGIGKDEEKLVKYGKEKFKLRTVSAVKENMWRFPAEIVADYATQDAVVTYQLYEKFVPKLKEEELVKIYNLERKLIPLLLEMRWRGIRVDEEKIHIFSKRLREKEEQLTFEIKQETGVEIKLTDPKSAGPALINAGYDVPLTPKTGQMSVKKEWLESLSGEIPRKIVTARTYNKIRRDFIDKMETFLFKGRVHSELNSVKGEYGGTTSGRFSCRNPNIQQIPARDPELGPLSRSLFLPEEGELWASLDYSSQEPRLTAHIAYILGAKGGSVVVNAYNENPRLDYHQMVADLCGIKRKQAKAINLGLAYGMGGAKLCHALGLPTEIKVITDRETGEPREIEVAGSEGADIIRQYNEKAPFISSATKILTGIAKEKGFVRTILGRKCRFPHGRFTYKALNAVIQGSAADQTKLALLQMWNKGIVPLTTIHDEIAVSVKDYKDALPARDIMVNCLPLEVPIIVDMEIGPSWGTTKLIEENEIV